jgi:hypothetical protein
MSEMIVSRTLSKVPPAELRTRAETLARELADEIHIVWSWQGEQVIRFESNSGVAKGLKGTLSIVGQNVVLRLELTFLLEAMGTKLRKTIDERLAAVDHP